MGLFLGREKRRRQALLQPILGFAIAMAETGAMVMTVRLLFLLVQDHPGAKLTMAGLAISLSFRQLTLFSICASSIAIVLRIIEARLTATCAADAVHGARMLVLDAWFATGWEHVAGQRLGRLQQLVGANSQQAATAVLFLATASVCILNLSMYLVVVLLKSPITVVLISLVAGFAALVFTPVRRKQKVKAKVARIRARDVQLTATSHAPLAREIHVYNVAEEVTTVLGGLSRSAADALREVRVLARLYAGTYQQFVLISLVMMLLTAKALGVSTAAFGVATVLLIRSLSYFQQLNTAALNFVEGRPYLDELKETIEEQRRVRRPVGTEQIAAIESIELKDVSYQYVNGYPVLSNVDLRIEKGEWLGIVGPSGAGKTTLINLIAGLIAPSDGQYCVNGKKSTTFAADEWARSFAIVSQDPILLRATIGENIAFYRNASKQEIVFAAEMAGIRSEVESMVDGFDTMVGDGAASMSGGQRQRVSLARALLKAPGVLILDEITSALDQQNAELIEARLSELPSSTIVIVVSHRPTLLKRCNRFLILQNGGWGIVQASEHSEIERFAGQITSTADAT
jgi:ATP-binding cassette subfamily B protein